MIQHAHLLVVSEIYLWTYCVLVDKCFFIGTTNFSLRRIFATLLVEELLFPSCWYRINILKLLLSRMCLHQCKIHQKSLLTVSFKRPFKGVNHYKDVWRGIRNQYAVELFLYASHYVSSDSKFNSDAHALSLETFSSQKISEGFLVRFVFFCNVETFRAKKINILVFWQFSP